MAGEFKSSSFQSSFHELYQKVQTLHADQISSVDLISKKEAAIKAKESDIQALSVAIRENQTLLRSHTKDIQVQEKFISEIKVSLSVLRPKGLDFLRKRLEGVNQEIENLKSASLPMEPVSSTVILIENLKKELAEKLPQIESERSQLKAVINLEVEERNQKITAREELEKEIQEKLQEIEESNKRKEAVPSKKGGSEKKKFAAVMKAQSDVPSQKDPSLELSTLQERMRKLVEEIEPDETFKPRHKAYGDMIQKLQGQLFLNGFLSGSLTQKALIEHEEKAKDLSEDFRESYKKLITFHDGYPVARYEDPLPGLLELQRQLVERVPLAQKAIQEKERLTSQEKEAKKTLRDLSSKVIQINSSLDALTIRAGEAEAAARTLKAELSELKKQEKALKFDIDRAKANFYQVVEVYLKDLKNQWGNFFQISVKNLALRPLIDEVSQGLEPKPKREFIYGAPTGFPDFEHELFYEDLLAWVEFQRMAKEDVRSRNLSPRPQPHATISQPDSGEVKSGDDRDLSLSGSSVTQLNTNGEPGGWNSPLQSLSSRSQSHDADSQSGFGEANSDDDRDLSLSGSSVTQLNTNGEPGGWNSPHGAVTSIFPRVATTPPASGALGLWQKLVSFLACLCCLFFLCSKKQRSVASEEFVTPVERRDALMLGAASASAARASPSSSTSVTP